jgi:hypothetical protein
MIQVKDAVLTALQTYTPNVEEFWTGKPYSVEPYKYMVGSNARLNRTDDVGILVMMCKKYGFIYLMGPIQYIALIRKKFNQ